MLGNCERVLNVPSDLRKDFDLRRVLEVMRIDERVDTCVRGLQMDVAAGEGMLEHSEEGEVVAWSQCGEELGGLVGEFEVHPGDRFHVLRDFLLVAHVPDNESVCLELGLGRLGLADCIVDGSEEPLAGSRVENSLLGWKQSPSKSEESQGTGAIGRPFVVCLIEESFVGERRRGLHGSWSGM